MTPHQDQLMNSVARIEHRVHMLGRIARIVRTDGDYSDGCALELLVSDLQDELDVLTDRIQSDEVAA